MPHKLPPVFWNTWGVRRFRIPASFLWLLVLFPNFCNASSSHPLWTQDESILWAGAFVAAGGLTLIDEDIRVFVQKNRGDPLDSVAGAFNTLGDPLSTFAIGSGFYAYGRMREDFRTAETGKLAVQAVLGSQVAVLALKIAVGRDRPGGNGNAHTFQPFSYQEDGNSFPSGHAAASFALASVLAQRSTSPWAPYAYYGCAGAVGVSRLIRDDHWVSDVLVGALIGETAARLTMRWHEGQQENAGPGYRMGIIPVHGGGLLSVAGSW